ncbi:hypothetical protein Taro_016879, partial [Colocasia esculenta]|nr:hypothetical protein [Colocasia esculenta]
LRHGVCRLLEGDMAYVAFPSRRPRRSLTDVTDVLCVSTALAVSGERDEMADPGLKPGRPSPSPSLSLALSELPAVLGCLPCVEAAVLRRVLLRPCRGRVRAVRCEEETFQPTRRPQRVRSSRGGRDARSSRPKHAPLPLRDVVFFVVWGWECENSMLV